MDDAARFGTLMGDFARGADLSAWPPAVERAIRLHRRIDAFTDSHALVLAAKRELPLQWRRYAGIVLDVYFDHLLIRGWSRWHAEPIEQYVDDAHDCLARIAPQLGEPARSFAARMAAHRALLACATPAGMAGVLARIGTRLSRPVRLEDALPAALAAHERIEAAFTRFFPLLRAEAASYLAASTLSSRPSEWSVSR